MSGTVWADLNEARALYALRGATYEAKETIKSFGGAWNPTEKTWTVRKERMNHLAEELRRGGLVVRKGRPIRTGSQLGDVATLLGLADESNPELSPAKDLDPDFIQHRADVVEAWMAGWSDRVESTRATPDEFDDSAWVEQMANAFYGHDEALRLVLWMIRKKIGDIGTGEGGFPLGDAAAVDTEISRVEHRLAAGGAA